MTWNDVTWRDMTGHDVTWRDMTRHDVTWRDMTWHDGTGRDGTWRDVTWHDMSLSCHCHETDISLNSRPTSVVTWGDWTWHYAIWRFERPSAWSDMMQHHVMWHYIAVILRQERLWDCFSLFIANFVEPMTWMLWQAMYHVISYPVTPRPCRNDAISRLNYVLHVILFHSIKFVNKYS